MPITSPSYFPPARGNGSVVGQTAGLNFIGAGGFLAGKSAGNNATIADLIVIGDSSGNAGIIDNDLEGTVIIGAGSANALVGGTGLGLPITLLGSDNIQALQAADSTVIVGSNILSTWGGSAGIDSSVFIGNSLFSAAAGSPGPAAHTSVVIGYKIGNNVASFTAINNSVLIGNNMLTGISTQGAQNSVLIGGSVGNSITAGTNNNVLIGSNADTTVQGTNSVIIGSAASNAGGNPSDAYNVLIGSSASTRGNLSVAIGAGAKSASNAANIGSVSIGANAGSSLPITATNVLVIEASTTIGGGSGNTPNALIYGDFLAGNLILGTSIQGTNRDFGGTGVSASNIVKLLNGAKSTGGNPVGGGYFYVVAGALHWVGSAGTDTPIAVA